MEPSPALGQLLTVDVPTPVTSLPSMVPPDIRAVAVLCVTVADGEVPVIVMVRMCRRPAQRWASRQRLRWRHGRRSGTRQCSSRWLDRTTDMRPLSLRKEMEADDDFRLSHPASWVGHVHHGI
jgi:hypothetical protein